MRDLSGHHPKSRLFHLSRACGDPSESLQRQIFPKPTLGEPHCSWRRMWTNLAARGFLNLMIQFREIPLQDAAVLYSLLPPSIISHIIFGPEFQQFRHDLLQRMQYSTNPIEYNYQLAMSLLWKQLEVQHMPLTVELSARPLSIRKQLTGCASM